MRRGWIIVGLLLLAIGATIGAINMINLKAEIADLKKEIATKADVKNVADGFANVRQELLIKLQNSELERDRVDQVLSGQIANVMQSVDNLADGVRDLVRERTKFTDATTALTEAEAKVASIEQSVRTLIAALEESRQAAAGVGGSNVTVLSPEDQVLSAIEVANLVDRLDREIKALRDQLAEARLLEKDIRERQNADEAEGPLGGPEEGD